MLIGRIAVCAACVFVCGCHRSTEPAAAVHLVDLFGSARIEGAPRGAALEPGALWDFAHPPAGTKDPLLGWKAGPGVTGLKVANGRLTGRTTADFPILYVGRPVGADPNDEFDSIELRIRASQGANLDAATGPAKPEFAQLIRVGRLFPWNFHSPLRAGEDFQTLTVAPQRPERMSWGALMLRPSDAPGATFEIESIRAVSQRERRASIRSGVGWHGLGDVYQEGIATRSPEKFTLDVDVPDDAWLDLNLGSLEDHPVTFKIAAVSGGREQVLLSRTLTTPHRWEPAPVDLSNYAGRTTLRFWLDVPDERSIGFWGSPVIRVRGARPLTARTAAAALGGVTPPQGVILIMCDTLRKDHLPMYGYKRDTTPNLSRMASQGTLFLDNVSQATWTKVSTPSIMTSLYPTSHRVQDFSDRLSPAADTLAKIYRHAGYATVSYSSVLFTGRFTNLQQGFEELHEHSSLDDPKYESKTARPYVDLATAWIERHRDGPFFMFLHITDPHDPYQPRAPYDALWANLAQKQTHEQQLEKIRKGIKDPLMQRFGMPSREELQAAGVNPAEYVSFDEDWYDGSIRGMDAEVGRLVERLRGMGLEDKVQIAFLADHGEEFLEHGRMFHGQTVYGELSSVPLMLYRPGVMPAGVKIAQTTRSIDLMPTLLDLSGLAAPPRVQGQSLVPLLAAARDHRPPDALGWKPQPAVTEKAGTVSGGGPPPRDTESYGVVSEGWRLVDNVRRGPGVPEFELYHHPEDPLDLKDVAGQHSDVVQRLSGQLEAWRKMVLSNQLPKGATSEGISSKDLERLRSLGYVQ
jgi:arylsulfatase A-like enzyme